MNHESRTVPDTYRRMGRKLRSATLWVLLAPLAACDPPDEPPPDPTMGGELMRGEFEYRCAGSNDAFCVDFVAQRFPQRFAVGGNFEVGFNPTVSIVATPGVQSSAPSLLEPTSSGVISGFRFNRPGTAALLAVINDEEMVDYLHVTAERVLSYHFSDEAGAVGVTEIVMQPGESRRVTVEPRGEFGQVLAGTLEYTWSTDEGGIARTASDTQGRTVQIQAVAAGRTRLLVEGGEVTGSVEVIVQLDDPTTTTTTTGSTGDSDSDTDSASTGSDTGTDTDSDGETDTDADTDTDGGTTSTGGGR